MEHPGLALALDYAKIGWKVFPVVEKKPLTKNGFHDASNDPADIRLMFSRHNEPIDRVGIAARPSGLLIIDIDVKSGDNGLDSFKRVNLRHPEIDYGPIQRTPSGGWHVFFKYPNEAEINNKTGVLPGIDVRTAGYVVSGAGYEWLPENGPREELPPCPYWWLDILTEPKKATNFQLSSTSGLSSSELLRHLSSHYLREAYPGQRNQAAYKFGQQMKYADIPLPEAELEAVKFARACPPGDHPFTEKEAVKAIRSAYRSTTKRPAWVIHDDPRS